MIAPRQLHEARPRCGHRADQAAATCPSTRPSRPRTDSDAEHPLAVRLAGCGPPRVDEQIFPNGDSDRRRVVGSSSGAPGTSTSRRLRREPDEARPPRPLRIDIGCRPSRRCRARRGPEGAQVGLTRWARPSSSVASGSRSSTRPTPAGPPDGAPRSLAAARGRGRPSRGCRGTTGQPVEAANRLDHRRAARSASSATAARPPTGVPGRVPPTRAAGAGPRARSARTHGPVRGGSSSASASPGRPSGPPGRG
jgi:hypothetical protein